MGNTVFMLRISENRWQAYLFNTEGNLIGSPFYWMSNEDAIDQTRRQEWYTAMEDLAGTKINFQWLEPFIWEGD